MPPEQEVSHGMTTAPAANYYLTQASEKYPDGRLVKAERGRDRGLILDQRTGAWHEVSGIAVDADGLADCAHLTAIDPERAEEIVTGRLAERKTA